MSSARIIEAADNISLQNYEDKIRKVFDSVKQYECQILTPGLASIINPPIEPDSFYREQILSHNYYLIKAIIARDRLNFDAHRIMIIKYLIAIHDHLAKTNKFLAIAKITAYFNGLESDEELYNYCTRSDEINRRVKTIPHYMDTTEYKSYVQYTLHRMCGNQSIETQLESRLKHYEQFIRR